MNLIRRHWYNIGGVVALATLVYIVCTWRGTNRTSLLLLLNFAALLIHQFEEYGWPGGEPAVMNMALRPSDRPDRYPLNQNSAAAVNMLLVYTFYLIPVFLPNLYWLGIAPTLFGFGQFVIHGIWTPKKLGSFYNPGLAAVLLLHFPIGIAYLHHIAATGNVKPSDWLIAIVYMFAVQYLTLIKMTYAWMASKDSSYPFAPEEMARFDVPAKLRRRSLSISRQ